MNATQAIATHIAHLSYDGIPPATLKDMQTLMLDYLGVALGGVRTESGRIAAEFSRDLNERGEATIIGYGFRVSCATAAFCNAILSHSIELDDTDHLAFLHFSPPTFSAALAMAESRQATGQAFLTAVVAGCDVVARLSRVTNPALRDRGFHTTPTCGVFGAAAAAGKILGLDAQQQASALGLAGAHASGLMEMYGSSMQKRINPGPAARGGVVAAVLAQRGFTGAENIFEGDRGFCRAFAGVSDLHMLTANLGRDFPIFIEYKPYACARPIHNAIDCALELVTAYPMDLAAIQEIVVRRHPAWADYHTIAQPHNYHEAQVSLPYSVAIALMEGKATVAQYTDAKLTAPQVLQLARKVRIIPDASLPRGVSCAMKIVTANGRTYEARVDYAKGSRENPMTDAEHKAKFRALASPVLSPGKIEQVSALADNLAELEDISQLSRLLY
ncbi:MAG: MmgE/PrpD family protein [Desulfobacterales bacterium]|nr:MAG: MmgE/PrpD family protein [Desulfobacterales bacterium]